jgi:hypothetical protein
LRGAFGHERVVCRVGHSHTLTAIQLYLTFHISQLVGHLHCIAHAAMPYATLGASAQREIMQAQVSTPWCVPRGPSLRLRGVGAAGGGAGGHTSSHKSLTNRTTPSAVSVPTAAAKLRPTSASRGSASVPSPPPTRAPASRLTIHDRDKLRSSWQGSVLRARRKDIQVCMHVTQRRAPPSRPSNSSEMARRSSMAVLASMSRYHDQAIWTTQSRRTGFTTLAASLDRSHPSAHPPPHPRAPRSAFG